MLFLEILYGSLHKDVLYNCIQLHRWDQKILSSLKVQEMQRLKLLAGLNHSFLRFQLVVYLILPADWHLDGKDCILFFFRFIGTIITSHSGKRLVTVGIVRVINFIANTPHYNGWVIAIFPDKCS